MKKILIGAGVILALIISGVIYFFFLYVPPPDNTDFDKGALKKTYPPPGDYPLYPIEQLLDDWENVVLVGGKYNTIGYVVRYFECGTCPAGADCIQCRGEGLIVSDKVLDPTDFASPNVLIITDDFNQFEIGKQYEFSISIDAVLNEITFMGARELTFNKESATDAEIAHNAFGNPTSFSIYYNVTPYGVERQEVWDYKNLGFAFSFVDGRYLDTFLSKDTREAKFIKQSDFNPLTFAHIKNLDAITAIIGVEPSLSGDLNPEISSDTRIYVYPGGYFVTTINDIPVYIHYQ